MKTYQDTFLLDQDFDMDDSEIIETLTLDITASHGGMHLYLRTHSQL